MNGGGGFAPTDFMIQSSIVSAASKTVATGYHFLDAVLIIFIMSIVGSLKDFLPNILQSVKDWFLYRFKSFRKQFVHFNELVIEDTAHHNTKHNFVSRPEFRNTMHLLRAIESYLNDNAKVEVVAVNVDNDGQGNNDYDRMKKNSVLYSCKDKNLILPNGIRVSYERITERSEATDNRVIKTVIILKTTNSHQFLKDFVQDCLDKYIETKYKEYDTNDQLYFYTLDVGSSLSALKTGLNGGGDKNSLLNWRRYDLSAKRSFDSLFFDKKPDLLRLIDNFTNKTGMYSFECWSHSAIPGTRIGSIPIAADSGSAVCTARRNGLE